MKTGLLLQPLPPDSGILFGSISYEDVVPAHLDYVQSTEFATSLKKGRATAMTIEHLMAVLHACRITNLMVKMIEEIPIMDGSALEFCKMIEEAGMEEQEGSVEEQYLWRTTLSQGLWLEFTKREHIHLKPQTSTGTSDVPTSR